jgi:hypothetical protein
MNMPTMATSPAIAGGEVICASSPAIVGLSSSMVTSPLRPKSAHGRPVRASMANRRRSQLP